MLIFLRFLNNDAVVARVSKDFRKFIVDLVSTEKMFSVDFSGFQWILGFAWCLCYMYNVSKFFVWTKIYRINRF